MTKISTLVLGFASWADNSFELIVRDDKTGDETTLCGTLKPGQLEMVSKVLPTCVFVPAFAHPINPPSEGE